MVKSAINFPLAYEGHVNLGDINPEAVDYVTQLAMKIAQFKRRRGVANVLGLAVVTAVNYAQGVFL
jgi:hypothetical protein